MVVFPVLIYGRPKALFKTHYSLLILINNTYQQVVTPFCGIIWVARHWPNRAIICFFLDEVTGWWQKWGRTLQGRAHLTTGQKNDFSRIHYCRFAGTKPGGGDTCPHMQRKADGLVTGQPGLWNELKNCQKYTEIPCLEKNQKKKSQNKTKNSYCVFSYVTHS